MKTEMIKNKKEFQILIKQYWNIIILSFRSKKPH